MRWDRLRFMWTALAIVGLAGLTRWDERAPLVGLVAVALGFAPDLLRLRRVVLSCAVIGIVLGIGFWYGSGRLEEIELTSHELRVSGSAEERVAAMKLAAYGFVERPLFGWGYQSFMNTSWRLTSRMGASDHGLRRLRNVCEPHSGVLEAFYNGGLLAGLPFVGFFVAWFASRRTFFTERSQDATVGAVGAAIWSLGAYFGGWLMVNQLLPGSAATVTFGLLAGTALAIVEEGRRPPDGGRTQMVNQG